MSYVQNVETINFGAAVSIVSLVRASGKKGKRLALPNSRFRPCISVKESFGQAMTISQEVDEKSRLLNKIRLRYCKSGIIFQQCLSEEIKINISESDFSNPSSSVYNYAAMISCLNNPIVLNANQAKLCGLIDKIDKS
jgi:ATP-dependent protease ClpP protease subunit